MIRKKAVTLVLTVLVMLAILVSLQAVNIVHHNSVSAGNHPSIILADNPTPTPNSSNPSGGGNGGG